jgi:hypothetical protein
MPKIHYSQVIEEDAQELKELERYHRYTHLFQRVRMLRLLKTEECTNLGEAARALGYSWRQCHRWFASYKKGGLQELLRACLVRVRVGMVLYAISYEKDISN